ncbi:P-loop containing nucleoside triphosphate hydrolase protein [Mycena floridula]|nr:P-loop containing nucleoside triphosphate hydrolase protein [Mycena floridula]
MSAADVSASDYARRCKELIDLARDIRNLGSETSVKLDLPCITVIGAQSAGKSSLIEAVAGISVPRDSGICTRCPMEVTMNSSDTWSCNISLRIDHDRHGQAITPVIKPFGPSALTDKSEVEIWLRRAQAAILCPHLSEDTFYTKSREALQELTRTDSDMLPFCQNVVQVNLKDSEMTDLTFVDLPGLIQNAAPHLIRMVHDLVVRYIKGQSTIILVAIPMSDDMETQQAMLLAKENDANGDRTIGVVTKPDQLTAGASGARQRWKDIMLGREHVLKHGYYIVRLPDDDERSLNLSREDSQRLAREFFETTAPWSEFQNRNRFGIPGFVSDISKLLVSLLEANLPKLRRRVAQLLAEDAKELEGLPAPPRKEPTAELLLRIQEFGRAIFGAVMGDSNKKFVQTNKKHYEKLKRKIRGTCPDFRPFVNHTDYRDPGLSHHDIEEINAGEMAAKAEGLGEVFDLTAVRREIEESITWELPFHVPFDATKTLILRFTEKWQVPCKQCFQGVFITFSQFIQSLVTTHFGQFKSLETRVWNLTEQVMETSAKEALIALERMMTLENHTPLYTQNTHYYKVTRTSWLEKYLAMRKNPSSYKPILAREPSPVEEFCAPASPSYRDRAYSYYESPVMTEIPTEIPRSPSPVVKDEYHDELEVMANVRAYFQVAYKRVIDHLPMLIEHELNQKLAKQLPQTLGEALLGDPDIKDLLSEDPEIANRRKFLEGRIARLNEIKERLNRLGDASA